MGIWGPGIFQNDIAEDVRDEYLAQLKSGKTNREVTAALMAEYQTDGEESAYDNLEFLLALAMVQWKYGRLMPEVKAAAMELLRTDEHLEEWTKESRTVYRKRCEVIRQFRETMDSPMPPEKPVRIRKPFVCPWQVGDVFAMPVQDAVPHSPETQGKYIVFQKIRSMDNGEGDEIPVLHVAKALFDHLPAVEEFRQCKLQPFDRIPEEYLRLLPEARGIYGFCYALAIDARSVRTYPRNIVLLGNDPVHAGAYERSHSLQQLDNWRMFETFVIQWHTYWQSHDPATLVESDV